MSGQIVDPKLDRLVVDRSVQLVGSISATYSRICAFVFSAATTIIQSHKLVRRFPRNRVPRWPAPIGFSTRIRGRQALIWRLARSRRVQSSLRGRPQGSPHVGVGWRIGRSDPRPGHRNCNNRHQPEEIVAKLRQVDVLTAQGQSVAEAIRSMGVTEVSCATGCSTARSSPL